MAASPEQVDAAIDVALDCVREFFRANCCALLSVADDRTAAHVRLACYAEGVSRVHRRQPARRVPVDAGCACRACARLGVEPGGPARRGAPGEAELGGDGRSCLRAPIERGGSIRHLIVIDTVHDEQTWPDALGDTTPSRVLGELFAGCLDLDEMIRRSARPRRAWRPAPTSPASPTTSSTTHGAWPAATTASTTSAAPPRKSGGAPGGAVLDGAHPSRGPRAVVESRSSCTAGASTDLHRVSLPPAAPRRAVDSPPRSRRAAEPPAAWPARTASSGTSRKGSAPTRSCRPQPPRYPGPGGGARDDRSRAPRRRHAAARRAGHRRRPGRAPAATGEQAEADAGAPARGSSGSAKTSTPWRTSSTRRSWRSSAWSRRSGRPASVWRRSSVEISLDLDPKADQLARDAALCLFRVAQEALNNVARHSRARRRGSPSSRWTVGSLLAVRDDGVGFDPASAGPGEDARARRAWRGAQPAAARDAGHRERARQGHRESSAWVPARETPREPSLQAAGAPRRRPPHGGGDTEEPPRRRVRAGRVVEDGLAHVEVAGRLATGRDRGGRHDATAERHRRPPPRCDSTGPRAGGGPHQHRDVTFARRALTAGAAGCVQALGGERARSRPSGPRSTARPTSRRSSPGEMREAITEIPQAGDPGRRPDTPASGRCCSSSRRGGRRRRSPDALGSPTRTSSPTIPDDAGPRAPHQRRADPLRHQARPRPALRCREGLPSRGRASRRGSVVHVDPHRSAT